MIEFKVTKRTEGKFKKDLCTKDFYKDYLAYQVNLYAENDPQKALMLVVSLIISLFLLKNIF